MRIDADDSLGERLDKVKAELYIGGKGHSETIRRLIDHYEQNRDLNQILDRRMAEIQKTVETGILDAFMLFLTSLRKKGFTYNKTIHTFQTVFGMESVLLKH